ncbi:acyl-CoA dehydrogenase family protein [Asticcacaulis sp. BYS171W]|uniref:Acyl-CoA dehydrogenase family protein n=1 Tax=Asticcacaulis aquaticus TaxID=2984212 RepID=A0ABT5HUT2_9CAUL|nr:acyl-CoA dehydrogenase family protein [Asticcacaulis aquaticus]MDC7683708.1 acyl-CoA dehydrogenase family protein [Asticcacaulis aquaticus]
MTHEQQLIIDTAQAFAAECLRPFAGEWDAQKHFPVDTLREAAALGFAAIYTREDHGGSGLTRHDGVLIFEQLAQGCIATAAFLSIHNMCTWMVDAFGREDQRARWIPRLVNMDLIASYCLTEPGSGSDAAAMKTTATRDGEAYVLNGSKAFISGAGASDLYVVMARADAGISAFLVEKATPGLSFGANEHKMGWNAQPTRQVMFDGVRIPAENRLGAEGEGFKFAMKGLDGGRLNIAACALGGAQDALDRALRYAHDRQQFGKRLDEFQMTQFRLADMETELQAARALLYAAAQKLDEGAADATKWCAMAKRFVTDTAFRVANDALQIHGGYGYLHDYGVERIVRDLRVHQILEGTNEIMRVIIARSLIG